MQCILLNIDYLEVITNFSLNVHSTCSISTLIVVTPVNLEECFSETALEKNATLKM